MAKKLKKSNKKKAVEIVYKKDSAKDKSAEIEIISPKSGQSPAVTAGESFDKKRNNIFIGTLNIISQPLKDRHEKHYKDSYFHLFVDLILAGIIVFLIAIIIAMFLWNPKPELVLKSFSENLKIVSGQQETFVLDYEHKSGGLLENANISVKFPSNFKFLKSFPSDNFNPNSNVFSLGDLPEGSNGKLKISGLVYGQVGEQQKISYNFSYAKKGKIFNDLSFNAFNIEDTVLEISFDSPDYIYQGIRADKKIYLKNKSDFKIDLVEIALSGGLKILEVQSDFDHKLEADSIIIKSIGPGEEGYLDLAMLAEGLEGEALIKMGAYLYAGGSRLLQKKIERTINVRQPALKINFSADPLNTRFNEPIDFIINYENISDYQLNDTFFKISPGDNDFLIKDIKLDKIQNAYLKDGDIYLSQIASGQSGSFNLEISFSPIKRKLNQQVFFNCELSYNTNGEKITYQSASPKIKILSDFNIKSGAYYYSSEGDQLGIGPLPPKLGIPTKYWINWDLKNYGNDLKNIVISAELAPEVSWTENKSVLAGRLIYGEISNLVVWEIDSLKKEGDDKHSWYEISYLPALSDLGKEKVLLSNLKFSAFDEFCGEKITGELENISTDLKYDLLAQDKGEVSE